MLNKKPLLNNHFMISLLIVVGGGVGCNQTVDAPLTGNEEGTFELVSTEPIVFDGTGSPYYRELIVDGGLEQTESISNKLQYGVWSFAKQDATTETARIESGENGNQLSILPGSESASIVYQTHQLGSLKPGDRFTATAQMFAAKNTALALIVDVPNNGEVLSFSEWHPGNGSWSRVEVSAPVYSMFTGPVTLRILRRGAASESAQVDDVSLALFPATDSERGGQRKRLLRNGGFEHQLLSGQLYPWEFIQSGAKKERPVFRVPAQRDDHQGFSLLLGETASFYSFTQELRIPSFQGTAEKSVRVSADVLAGENSKFILSLRLQTGKNRAVTRVNHPNDGQWHRLSVEAPETVGQEGGTYFVQLQRSEGSVGDVVVDNITLDFD